MRSGKEYEGPKMPKVVDEDISREIFVEKKSEPPVHLKVPAPFPSRLRDKTKEEEEQEIMNLFGKVEVNIPLLDAIKEIPRYAKVLKQLCTSKRKLYGNYTMKVGANISAIIQKRVPPKCKDPGVFSVPCKLGDLPVAHAMMDLGASINVLPYSIFKTLKCGTLQSTGVVAQLADRSLVRPMGVLEDVLVQVRDLIFPADFYVIDMGDDDTPTPNSILLGRPFMKTSNIIIDMKNDTISMECDEQKIHISIHDSSPPIDESPKVKMPDTIDPNNGKVSELSNREMLELVLNRHIKDEDALELTEKLKLEEGWLEKGFVAVRGKRKGITRSMLDVVKKKFAGCWNAPEPT